MPNSAVRWLLMSHKMLEKGYEVLLKAQCWEPCYNIRSNHVSWTPGSNTYSLHNLNMSYLASLSLSFPICYMGTINEIIHTKWSAHSVQFSLSVVSDSLQPHESQHARPPCPSPTPKVHSDSRPSSQWCHPAISSSVVPFSSCPQSLPASESLPMSQLLEGSKKLFPTNS